MEHRRTKGKLIKAWVVPYTNPISWAGAWYKTQEEANNFYQYCKERGSNEN